MRRKRFSEEQIVSILKESAAGMKTEEVCRRHGICTNTFYRWKAKYAAWRSPTSASSRRWRARTRA